MLGRAGVRADDSGAQLGRLNNRLNIAAIRKLRPQPDGSFSFIVLGDNRNGDATYKRLVARINRYADAHTGAGKPLFMLHTGDMVPSGTLSEWRNFAQLRGALKMPVVFVPGNHEMRAREGAADYASIVGQPLLAFDFAGCRFIGLDNTGGRFSARGIQFLRQYLGLPPTDAAGPAPVTPQPRSFLFFHEPPYVGRWRVHAMKPDNLGGHGGEMLQAAADAHVSAVLLGHIHLYDAIRIGDVPYIISAGGGAPLYGKYGFGHAHYGFLVVHVEPVAISWQWIDL